MLAPDTSQHNIIQYMSKEMRNPFSGEEIGKAAKKLKNGKSAGPDEVPLEMIKYALQAAYEEIVKIYNKVAKDGDELTELKLGLLRPLQKPGNLKDPLQIYDQLSYYPLLER